MVETRQMEDINDGYMYGDEGFGYIQDAEILDRPDLFYGPPGWHFKMAMRYCTCKIKLSSNFQRRFW